MIHKFIFDGTRLVLDVNSGALHSVSEVAWDVLDGYIPGKCEELVNKYSALHPRHEVEQAVGELELLVEQGFLFAGDPFNGSWEQPDHRVIKALCLFLSDKCNLQCRYCFAKPNVFTSASAGLMTEEVGAQAIDFLLTASGPRRRIEVDFFGGEPLLNFPVLKHLVSYGRERSLEIGKEINFTVTTNALGLTREIGNYLCENQISVILSLDGRPEVHDRMRVFPNGKGSYQPVFKNILDFIQAHPRANYYLRGTYTAYNPDFAGDVTYMFGQGFSKVSVEPVIAVAQEDYALADKDLPVLAQEYEKLTREIISRLEEGQEVDFYHFNIDFDEGVCLPKRLGGCGAGFEYLSVTSGGDLYPCHQFAGREGFLMGDVNSGVAREDLRQLFRNAHVYKKEGCGLCWARNYCSGGCHANAHLFNGSIYKPDQFACRIIKKRLECALYLKAYQAMKENHGINRLKV